LAKLVRSRLTNQPPLCGGVDLAHNHLNANAIPPPQGARVLRQARRGAGHGQGL
jgi:hypothetical protein